MSKRSRREGKKEAIERSYERKRKEAEKDGKEGEAKAEEAQAAKGVLDGDSSQGVPSV